MRTSNRSGYTLVEILVVIAIISLLLLLLFPAVQSARESARRTQCGNQIRQMVLAFQNYEGVKGRFPAGIKLPEKLLWTGAILPYIELDNLHKQIDLSQPWNVGANAQVCSTRIPLYRCPSSTAPSTMTAQGLRERIPCDYLACGSGTDNRESGPPPLAGDDDSDGVFFLDSQTRIAEVVDGTSNTFAVGDSFFQYEELDLDFTGYPQFLDRWCVGTLEGIGNEVSEAIGSTGVAMNSHRLEVYIDEKELAFGSQHPRGVMMGLLDGSLRFFSDEVDPAVWSHLGTRNGLEIIRDE